MVVCVGTLLSALPAHAKDQIPPDFWGIWGVSKEECADDDGPNFNTVIAADGIEQYENHCRLRSIKAQGAATLVGLSCEAEGSRYANTFKLAMTPQEALVLTMRGEYYKGEKVLALQRCPYRKR